jgi:hypothetical protein
MAATNQKTQKQPSFKFPRVPVAVALGLLIGWLTFRGGAPTLYDSDADVRGDFFTVRITNKGRTADVGHGWCAAGAFLDPGTGKITQLAHSASPDVFRYSTLVPDQQASLDYPVPVAYNPEAASRFNPLALKVNASTNWAVVCHIPYWDNLLGEWRPLERDLEFCYEVQPAGTNKRAALLCPKDELSKVIRELGGPN